MTSRFIGLSFALLLACGREAKRPDGGEGLLTPGANAPDFSATTRAGEPQKLSSLRGHPVIVYFYPKDGTPGCTKEACAFRDAWDKFTNAGVSVIGVSEDSEDSHRAFVKDQKLPFSLAADETGAIAQSYGVKTTMGMASRVTFLVGPDGRIAKVWPSVDPAVHAQEVLSAAVALGDGSAP